MKNRFLQTVPVAVIAFVLFVFPQVVLAGDPIPGLDVKLGKPPGGAIATATTDNSGTVTFEGLTPGTTYEIFIDPKQVSAFAIKEQGMKRAEGKTVEINLIFKKSGAIHVGGVEMQKNDKIDLLKQQGQIFVKADDKGQIRATINTTRSNIK